MCAAVRLTAGGSVAFALLCGDGAADDGTDGGGAGGLGATGLGVHDAPTSVVSATRDFGANTIGSLLPSSRPALDSLVVKKSLDRLRAALDIAARGTLGPHPRAEALVLPDGSPAPEALRLWAGVDAFYPTYLAERRSEQRIADDAGVVLAHPMREVLRAVCIEDVRDELEDDEDTLDYLGELVEGFVEEFPGFGVRLEPSEHPDRVLWLAPDGSATLLWYEDDAFDRREPFAAWAAALLEEDGG